MLRVAIILIIFATISNHVLMVASEDKTLEPKTSGKTVVEAVIQKIRVSRIFPEDYDLIYRIAYVESQFGKNTTNPSLKGIWQLREEEFNQTRSGLLNNFHTQIKQNFHINWFDLNWSSLQIPLYSGLAAYLHIQLYPEKIPEIIQGQAKFWEKFYTRQNNSAIYFLNKMEQLQRETPGGCDGKLDIIIILDGSVTGKSFEISKKFTSDLLSLFSSNNEHVRKGVIFTGHVSPFGILGLTNTLTTEEQQTKILRTANPKVNYLLLNAAVEYAINYFKSSPERPYPKILIIVTASVSSDGMSALEEAKYENITTIAIGVGNNVPESEILKLALGNPKYAFKLTNFSSLAEFFRRINREACAIPQGLNANEAVMDTLGQNQTRVYKYNVPEGGLLIDVQATYGAVEGYYSYCFAEPNGAIHDGLLGGQTEILEIHNSTVAYLRIEGVKNENSYGLIGLPRKPSAIPQPDFVRTAELSEAIRVKWEVYSNLEKVIFEVEAKTNGFVAFGISDADDEEIIDFVIGGINDDGMPYFYDRYSSGPIISKSDEEQNWKLIEVEELSSNSTTLWFIRSFSTGDEEEDLEITNRNMQYYWAMGETDNLTSHTSSGFFPVNILEPELKDFDRTEQLSEFFKVSWSVNFDTQKVTFDVTALTSGYVAFGISKTGDITDADLILGGVGEDLMPYFDDRHSTSPGVPILDQEQNWLLLLARQINGTTHLKFIRDFDTGDDKDIAIVNENTFFVYAVGATDKILFHRQKGSFPVNILRFY